MYTHVSPHVSLHTSTWTPERSSRPRETMAESAHKRKDGTIFDANRVAITIIAPGKNVREWGVGWAGGRRGRRL